MLWADFSNILFWRKIRAKYVQFEITLNYHVSDILSSLLPSFKKPFDGVLGWCFYKINRKVWVLLNKRDIKGKI